MARDRSTSSSRTRRLSIHNSLSLQAEGKTLRAVVDEEEKEMDKDVAHSTNLASISHKEVRSLLGR